MRRVTAEPSPRRSRRLIAADIDPEHQRLSPTHWSAWPRASAGAFVEIGDEFDPDLVARQAADLAWAGLRSVHRAS